MTKADRIPEILECNNAWTATELKEMSAAEVEDIHDRVCHTSNEPVATALDTLKTRVAKLEEKNAAGIIAVGRDLVKHAKGMM